MKLPEGKLVAVPDGLQHTKFTARRAGRATHILCSRELINYTSTKEWRQAFGLVRIHAPHPNLIDYISHLLRLRVLQELELLAEQLECSHQTFKASHDLQPILRRLTRREWKQLKETDIVPFSDAVAVLVVPPLNKNPVTGQTPEPSMSASPIPSNMKPRNDLPPLSSLLLSRNEPDCFVAGNLPDLMSTYRIPLYNGLALFPNEHQRAALHALLLRILAAERRLYQSTIDAKGNDFEGKGQALGDEKHSHAFLLSSNSNLIRRGDVSPVAIALWRIRMFEGNLGDNCTWTSTFE